MVCARFVLLVCSLIAISFCFQEDSFVVDVSSYEYYPPTLFEKLSFRTLSPDERFHSPSNIRSATNFLRPFATKEIKEGETVLSIPLSMGISGATIKTDLPFVETLSFSFAEEPFLVWLLYHRSLGDRSPHKTFIDSLPEKYVNPLTFTSEEWGALAVDTNSVRVNQIVNADRDILVKTRSQLYQKLEEYAENPLSRVIKDTPFEDYMWAYVTVKDLVRQTPEGLYIFPAMKFSHSPFARAPVFEDGHIRVLAGADIKEGEEIFVNYGNKSNHELLLHHSLFISHNPFDCIQFYLTAKNPYWLLVAEKLFGYTSDTYENCLPISFQPKSQVLIEMRTVVASNEELDALDVILAGNNGSIDNEARMLRALYYAIHTQINTAEDDLPDPNGVAAVEFWNLYTKEHQRAKLSVLQRILDLWSLYL